MAIEISNLSGAFCAVNVQPLIDTSSPPLFKGPDQAPPGPNPRQFANAGFVPFGPVGGATANQSEVVTEGILRMHLLQPFTFSGGMAAPLATVNPTSAQAALMVLFPPTIAAIGLDFGQIPGDTGSDVLIITGGQQSREEEPLTQCDFTLLVLQFPTQQTA